MKERTTSFVLGMMFSYPSSLSLVNPSYQVTNSEKNIQNHEHQRKNAHGSQPRWRCRVTIDGFFHPGTLYFLVRMRGTPPYAFTYAEKDAHSACP